jgi:hypothetical protein
MFIASEYAKFSGCVVHKGVFVAYISSLHSTTLYVSLMSLVMEEGFAWYLKMPWDVVMCN